MHRALFIFLMMVAGVFVVVLSIYHGSYPISDWTMSAISDLAGLLPDSLSHQAGAIQQWCLEANRKEGRPIITMVVVSVVVLTVMVIVIADEAINSEEKEHEDYEDFMRR